MDPQIQIMLAQLFFLFSYKMQQKCEEPMKPEPEKSKRFPGREARPRPPESWPEHRRFWHRRSGPARPAPQFGRRVRRLILNVRRTNNCGGGDCSPPPHLFRDPCSKDYSRPLWLLNALSISA